MVEGSYLIRRSRRRRRTLSIVREAGRLVVIVPDRLTRADESRLVPPLVERYLAGEASRRVPTGDQELQRRALDLFHRYLAAEAPGFEPEITLSWSTRQQRRWASATPATGSIRVSTRLQPMPSWVVDYVLIHELAHLLEVDHNRRFWQLVARYPQAESARGYLLGFADAQGWGDLDY